MFPVSAPAIEHGTVLLVDGKIAAVGAGVHQPVRLHRVAPASREGAP